MTKEINIEMAVKKGTRVAAKTPSTRMVDERAITGLTWESDLLP